MMKATRSVSDTDLRRDPSITILTINDVARGSSKVFRLVAFID